MLKDAHSNLKRAAGRMLEFRPGLMRHSVAWFLGALVVLMVTSPIVDALPQGMLIEGVLLSLVLVSALLSVGGRKKTLMVAAALLVPALTVQWVRHAAPGAVAEHWQPVAALLFVTFVTSRLLWYMLRAHRIDSEVLCAGVAVYLLVGLIWAMVYTLVDMVSPGSFKFAYEPAPERMEGFVSLYYSFTILSTVGFGDVVPITKMARMLSMAEAVMGVFYLALMISRLVSLYSAGGSAGAAEKAGA